MSYSLRRKRHQKPRWGRCPAGHRHCDDKFCKESRIENKIELNKFWPEQIADSSTHPAWDFELEDYDDR